MAFSLPKNKSVKQECTDLGGDESSSFPASSTEFDSIKQRRGGHKSRKEGVTTWTIETSAPFDDGYQWRKYGTKEIRSSNYPRTYFRCTYRDDRNCGATKQVQQKDFSNPPVYEVIYKNSHSCNSTPILDAKLAIHSVSSMNTTNLISFNFSTDPVHSDQHYSDLDVKRSQIQLNSNHNPSLQSHGTTSELSAGSSHETDGMYCESVSDYWSIQGLDELDTFDDLALREYMNLCD